MCFETQNGSIYFSYFVGNGLSSFLDSQDPKHIEQAIELIDAWETVISWTHGHSLYALGCVASRAGQTKRALNYIERAVEGGQSIWYMMRDLDSKTSGDIQDLLHYKDRILLID